MRDEIIAFGVATLIDPAIVQNENIFELNSLVGEYSFRIKGLPGVKIRVRIWQTDTEYGGDRFTYTISHLVQTPGQADPYSTSSPFGVTEKAALEKALRDTLSFYVRAIAEGHTPSSKWFIEDPDF